MKRIDSYRFTSLLKPKRPIIGCPICKIKKGTYHKPDCSIGFPVINKPSDELLELEAEGLVRRVFAGNVI